MPRDANIPDAFDVYTLVTSLSSGTSRGRFAFGVTGVLFLLIGFMAVMNFVYIPLISGGAESVHDAGSLPDRFKVCGRTWNRSAFHEPFTRQQIVTQTDTEPTLADPRWLAPCPQGACGAVAAGPCSTVIYVRVAEDAYVSYSLSGGP
jgi:hypothetical protein